MNDDVTAEYARLLRQVSAIKPSPEALQRALSRTRKALSDETIAAKGVPPEQFKVGNQRILRFAAAIAAVLLVAVGATSFLFFTVTGTSAFAQVQAAIEQVPSITFSVEVLKVPKGLTADSGTSMVDLVGNRFRFESADGAKIYVIDCNRDISMQLYPRQKRAVIVRSQSLDHVPSFMGFLKSLRDCDADLVEQLKDAKLDGRQVKRYRIRPEAPISRGVEMLVFVDPETHLPVQIESSTDALGGPLHLVCKNFLFDPRDPTLFATVPPQGYQIEQIDSDGVLAPEKVASAADNLGVPLVNIEFRVAEQAPGKGLVEAETPNHSSQKIYLHSDPIVTREHIESCRLVESGRAIEFTFTDVGSARMAKATSQVPKQLAMLIDGKVVSAVIVRSVISKKASITMPPDLVHLFSP